MKRPKMRDVREVMRLHREGAVAMREIARMTGMARLTIPEMVRQCGYSDLSRSVLPDIKDADLEKCLAVALDEPAD